MTGETPVCPFMNVLIFFRPPHRAERSHGDECQQRSGTRAEDAGAPVPEQPDSAADVRGSHAERPLLPATTVVTVDQRRVHQQEQRGVRRAAAVQQRRGRDGDSR